MEKKEMEFLKIAHDTMQSAKLRIDGANEMVLNNPQEIETPFTDFAGEQYALASELSLKSDIIYDDFQRNQRFNQDATRTISINGRDILCYEVGTTEWRNAIQAGDKNFKILNDPKQIRKIVLENNPNDERREIETDPQFNSSFLTLSYDGEKTNGHSLYAYYQLQSPVAKNLINTEYYCYIEETELYTIYALLTDDILKTSNENKTIMPREMMEKLDSVKEKAIELRYSSISGLNISKEELKFLKEFSTTVVTVGEYRFSSQEEVKNYDFEKYNYNSFIGKGIPLFDSLDSITKYNLCSLFNKKEKEALLNYTQLLMTANTSSQDLIVFINNCIYFKNIVAKKMKIDLEFTEKQYARIDNFCKSIKAFKPFDPRSKRLRDNEAFNTEDKKQYYINQMEKRKQKQKMVETSFIMAILDSEIKNVITKGLKEKDFIISENAYEFLTNAASIKLIRENKELFKENMNKKISR